MFHSATISQRRRKKGPWVAEHPLQKFTLSKAAFFTRLLEKTQRKIFPAAFQWKKKRPSYISADMLVAWQLPGPTSHTRARWRSLLFKMTRSHSCLISWDLKQTVWRSRNFCWHVSPVKRQRLRCGGAETTWAAFKLAKPTMAPTSVRVLQRHCGWVAIQSVRAWKYAGLMREDFRQNKTPLSIFKSN